MKIRCTEPCKVSEAYVKKDDCTSREFLHSGAVRPVQSSFLLLCSLVFSCSLAPNFTPVLAGG